VVLYNGDMEIYYVTENLTYIAYRAASVLGMTDGGIGYNNWCKMTRIGIDGLPLAAIIAENYTVDAVDEFLESLK